MVTDEQILEEVHRLTPEQRRLVYEFAQSLTRLPPAPLETGTPNGKSLDELLSASGGFEPDDLREMEAAIDAECERIDADGW